MVRWIVDAGPFIHLDQIGLLRRLTLLPHLVIPPSVVHELIDARASTELNALARWPNVMIMAPRLDRSALKRMTTKPSSLDRGERD